MEKDTGTRIAALKVDGGASRDNLLMRFQADILDAVIERPVIRETTALGAACLAGLAAGFWKNRQELAEKWKCEKAFNPAMDTARREQLLAGWHRAVERSRG
jgi:glycerol kinase